MWWIPLLLVLCIFVATALVLHRYGNLMRLRWYVILIVFLTWWINFSVIVITPVDVSATFYRHCLTTLEITNSTTPAFSSTNVNNVSLIDMALEADAVAVGNGTSDVVLADCNKPLTYVDNSSLRIIWMSVFWFAQLMTWGVIPIFQSYSDAGDFTFATKMRTALKENLLFYTTFGMIFGVFFIYIAIKESLNMKNLLGIGMAASNTWGLTAVVALLGYGLVDVPRRWYERCQREKWLQILYFNAAKAAQELDEVNEDLETAAKEIHVIKGMVSEGHALYDYVQLIVYKAPLYDTESLHRRGRSRNLPIIRADDITEKKLIKLHRKIIRARHSHERSEAINESCLEETMRQEDMINGRYRVHLSEEDAFLTRLRKRVKHLWELHLYRVFCGIMTIVTTVLSLVVVLSEAFSFVRSPILSPSAMLMHAFGLDYYYLVVEIFCITTICHMAVCTYNTLFRIRLFNYFHLTPNHHSDATSLLFSALCVSRLTPALIFNFLSINQLDGNAHSILIEEASFTQIMGHMAILPFIANGFMIFFPVVTVLLALAALFRIFNRCFYDEDLTSDLIDEGMSVVRMERRKRNRGNTSEASRSANSSVTAIERMRNQRRNLRERAEQSEEQHRMNEESIFGRITRFFGGDAQRVSETNMALLNHEDEDREIDLVDFDEPRPLSANGRADGIFDDV
eukprot:CFRG7859T1